MTLDIKNLAFGYGGQGRTSLSFSAFRSFQGVTFVNS